MHRLQIIKELMKFGYNKHGLINLSKDELVFMLKEENQTIESRKTDEEAFAPYIAEFKADVEEHGFELAFLNACGSYACGCMGPRDGNPYCHCEMITRTAKMFGKVVEV